MSSSEVRRERKVVTVLFADLVGFTSRAEQLDPEDVEAILRPYHERLRSELERFGGTVEKFIGDAVMALFGAPIAHEDDPERAVRAALSIRDWIKEEGELEVRIAVTTGEALVNLGARPEAGEGMASGDVVNTAARLQGAAPVNGILVSESTFRATRDAIDYREREQVAAKGKAEPVAVWEVLQARASFGVDVPHEARTELVGRTRELDVLCDALARMRYERAPQLVTIVGVPGIGKSRLVYELARSLDAEPDLTSWRQGRSLPYGEGVSFWALAEMVKAQAGILESDAAADADAKLACSLAGLASDAGEADWMRRHLSTLLGLGGDEGELAGDRRAEAFAAWRGFLEELADQRPLVLVFEDLHWADDGLLDFVDHLVDWASGVPILIIGTARPELLDRRPGWSGGKPNATTLSLSALSQEEMARLIGSLLARPLLAAEEQVDLLVRAGGNPLYAEQYARLLIERGDDEEELPLPESIHGIIAARLDGLAPADKRLLQDAAVIGKVFWVGAVAALDVPAERVRLEERLHALERKEWVRLERRSSVAGERQYAFLHLLARDVAYGQLPRTERIDKHRRAAEWIESLGRPESHAEMLAHHYLNALELARAAKRDTTGLAPGARSALAEAGDRAQSLYAFASAARFYRDALELWPEDVQEQRADLLFRLALALFGMGAEDADRALEEARAALLALGDRSRAGEAEAVLAEVWWLRADRDRCFEHLERALELVRDSPASPEKARVLEEVCRHRMLAHDVEGAVEAGSEALELAATLGLDEIRAHTLVSIGTARFVAGDSRGREDLEEGLAVARAGNRLEVQVRATTNLGFMASRNGNLREALRLALEAERLGERIGNADEMRFDRGNIVPLRLDVGEWDESLRIADELIAESERLGAHYQDPAVFGARAWIRAARGDLDAALEDEAEALVRARRAKDPQVLFPALGLSAWIRAEAGRLPEAKSLAHELVSHGLDAVEMAIDHFMWVAGAVGRGGEVLALLEAADDRPWFAVARAVLSGDYERAAEMFDAMGSARCAALARLRAAEALVGRRRRAEADKELQLALAFWRSVGATRYVRQGEALLAATA